MKINRYFFHFHSVPTEPSGRYANVRYESVRTHGHIAVLKLSISVCFAALFFFFLHHWTRMDNTIPVIKIENSIYVKMISADSMVIYNQ